MIITKKNLNDDVVKQWCSQFCQILNSLSELNIRLFGSIIRNWIGICYYYNLDPFNPLSFKDVLKYKEEVKITGEIDIWIELSAFSIYFNNNDRYLEYQNKILKILGNLNYSVEVSPIHTTILNNCRNLKLKCSTLFGSNYTFTLYLYGTTGFYHVFFDINNIYFQCGTSMNTKSLDLIIKPSYMECSRICCFQLSFNTNNIFDLLERCLRKECLLMPLENYGVHSLNKMKILGYYRELFRDSFQILNSPAVQLYNSSIKTDECSICQDEMTSISDISVSTKCNHIFHLNCLFEWWSVDQSIPSALVRCPNCRSTFNLVLFDDEE